MIENDLLLFPIHIMKKKHSFNQKVRFQRGELIIWAFLYTNVCNKVNRLSASPHQTLDMMILLEINDRERSFTVSHPYYEEKAFIYSKGAISERVVDNLGVSLYKCMLYSYQVISLPLPNVRYNEVSLNK